MAKKNSSRPAKCRSASASSRSIWNLTASVKWSLTEWDYPISYPRIEFFRTCANNFESLRSYAMAIQIISRSMFQIQFNFDVRSAILSHYCGIPNVPAKSEDGSDAQFRGTSCMGTVVQDVKYMACHNAVLTKVWGSLRFKNVQK